VDSYAYVKIVFLCGGEEALDEGGVCDGFAEIEGGVAGNVVCCLRRC
jgi:hypothetical protein